MLKNLLATVGLAAVVKVGFDLFVRYCVMEEENERWRAAYAERQSGAKKPEDADAAG